MKKATYLFPGVFIPDPENQGYTVYIPDLPGCVSEGDTLKEAYAHIAEAIGLYLEHCQNEGIVVPEESEMADVTPAEDEKDAFVSLVQFDQVKYDKQFHSSSVKKTLTIPEWLNNLAEKEHINFSGVLQEALKDRLNC